MRLIASIKAGKVTTTAVLRWFGSLVSGDSAVSIWQGIGTAGMIDLEPLRDSPKLQMLYHSEANTENLEALSKSIDVEILYV